MNLLINCNQLILIFHLLFVKGLKFVMHFENLVEALNDYLCGDRVTGHSPIIMSVYLLHCRLLNRKRLLCDDTC